MSKLQIIAKTALTVIGIHAIVLLLRPPNYILHPPASWWQQSVSYVLLISLIIIIGRLLIFKNDFIACRITGPGEKLPPNRAAGILVCSYRVALVFYGLYLLSSSTRQFNMLITILNPVAIRNWFNDTIYGGFDFLGFCTSTRDSLPHLIIITLIIYLIFGAPHFVRLNAKRILSTSQPIIEE